MVARRKKRIGVEVMTIDPIELVEKAKECLDKNPPKPPDIPKDTDDAKKRQLSGLTGAKTVAGKARLLANLKSFKKNVTPKDIAPEDLHLMQFDFDKAGEFYTKEERKFLEKRKREYLEAYDFDHAADKACLHFILEEELNLCRLYALKHFDKKGENELDGAIDKAISRFDKLTKNLKVQKQQRKDEPQESGLAVAASEADEMELSDDEFYKQMLEEEKEMLKKRNKKVGIG